MGWISVTSSVKTHFVYCSYLFAAAIPVDAVCHASGMCFWKRSDPGYSFADANQACVEENGTLAIIISEDMRTWVASQFTAELVQIPV